MKVERNKLLRNIWLINGIIILISLLIAGGILIYGYVSSIDNSGDDRGVIVGEEKEEAERSGLELQTILLSNPRRIPQTDISVISVFQKDYETPKSMREMTQSTDDKAYAVITGGDYGGSGMEINEIFIDNKKGTQKLLLDKKASINIMDIPDNGIDSLQKHIFYSISLKDTDKNGRINSNDREEYFISNLDGSDFRNIPLNRYKIFEYKFSEDYKKLYFICSIIPNDKNQKEEHWEKTLVEYDIETNKIYENKELTALIAKAKKIMLK